MNYISEWNWLCFTNPPCQVILKGLDVTNRRPVRSFHAFRNDGKSTAHSTINWVFKMNTSDALTYEKFTCWIPSHIQQRLVDWSQQIQQGELYIKGPIYLQRSFCINFLSKKINPPVEWTWMVLLMAEIWLTTWDVWMKIMKPYK